MVDDIGNRLNAIIIENNLEKIIEMTYSYKKFHEDKFFNITLFSDFGCFGFDDDINLLDVKKGIEFKINNILLLLNDLSLLLKQEALGVKGKILYKSILYIENILKVVLLGLDFELEKAGLKINNYSTIKLKLKQIEEIEENNFGFKIKNNLEEISLIHKYLFSLYVDKRNKINEKEQIFFLNYINTINNFLDNNSDLEINKIKRKKDKFNFWSYKILRDDYIKLFNYILENIYGLEQRAVITDASSIYDGDIFLEIPNKETHKELTYKRVLELIVHEIESHYINSYNNKIILGKFRGARNLEKEEGLAKVMEAFLVGETIDSMEFIPTYMAKILFSEIYKGDDFYKFLDIYNKMHTLRRRPTNEFLRQKRNYSLKEMGGQHKDISYGRGMLKVKKYLQNGGDFSLLFLGKVGFEDLEKLDKLYLENIDEVIFPIFIGDIIQLHLQFKETGSKLKLDVGKIVEYLEKKYDFKGIKRFNLRVNIGNKIEKIEKLLEFIDKLETNE